MAERVVEVWGKQYTIAVDQQSKSVWVATGTYMNEYVQTKGPTENAAANAWQTRTRMMGNP